MALTYFPFILIWAVYVINNVFWVCVHVPDIWAKVKDYSFQHSDNINTAFQ